MPVSWGPCCTRTILFFFFLFFNALLAPARTFRLPLSLSFSLTPPLCLPVSVSFLPLLALISSLFAIHRSVLSSQLHSAVYLSFFLSFSNISSLLSIGQSPSFQRSSCSSRGLFTFVSSACCPRLLVLGVIVYKIGYHLIAILEIEKSLVALSQCSVKRPRARRVQMCAVNFRVVKRDLFEISRY